MTSALTPIAHRTADRLRANPGRVVTSLFVPGQEGFDHAESRTTAVVARILALDDDEVEQSLQSVISRFDGRHRDLIATFDRHADELADRMGPRTMLSRTRRLLLGASFTSEYAVEGAALCNPSMVRHPDQRGVAAGALRFVMSVRGIGEGHRSSIGFRTGVIDPAGQVSVEAPSPIVTKGALNVVPFESVVFRSELQRVRGESETADFVLDALGPRFSSDELEEQLTRLEDQRATRTQAEPVTVLLREIARRTYGVTYPMDSSLSERVLIPAMHAESNGMEDARFVRFKYPDGTITYLATYTAYNGTEICQQLLETTDFCAFTSMPVVGGAAQNKGLALFPRQVGGRFAAMSRSDRESNAIAYSENLLEWDEAFPCQVPTCSWEVLQIGNCGSPIETDAGWLVLTHGVGPMRTYSIGAILLDLDDPSKVIGRLREPLLSPMQEEQDGYVPNVVYSCGALVHADTLVLPYGIGDATIGVATVPMPELIAALGGAA